MAARLAMVICAALLLSGCGAVTQNGSSGSNNTCVITADVSPATATADHSQLPPANQVTFTAASTVTGNCRLTPDFLGTWSSSDPADISLPSQPATQATATCLHATSGPATISYNGNVRGHSFNPGTLSCK